MLVLLSRPGTLPTTMAGRRADFLAAPAAMLGVLVFDALPGLFIGTAVSMLLLLYRAFRRHIARLAAAPTPARGSTSTATPI